MVKTDLDSICQCLADILSSCDEIRYSQRYLQGITTLLQRAQQEERLFYDVLGLLLVAHSAMKAGLCNKRPAGRRPAAASR